MKFCLWGFHSSKDSCLKPKSGMEIKYQKTQVFVTTRTWVLTFGDPQGLLTNDLKQRVEWMKSWVNPTSLCITMPTSQTKKTVKNIIVLRYEYLFSNIVYIKNWSFCFWCTKKHIDAECWGVEASGCLYKASNSTTMAALEPKPPMHCNALHCNVCTAALNYDCFQHHQESMSALQQKYVREIVSALRLTHISVVLSLGRQPVCQIENQGLTQDFSLKSSTLC